MTLARNVSLALVVGGGLVSMTTHAAVVYDEGVTGDLSGAFATPTPITFTAGTTNTVVGQAGNNGNGGATNNSDADYFEFTLGPGELADALTVDAYVQSGGSSGNRSFIAYSGTPFTGQGFGDIDGNTLFNLGSGNLFATSLITGTTLGPGTHRFWIQETLNITVDYELTFNVVPEPGAALLFGGSALAFLRRRR
ncbi:MAG: PEP-CTERM sorting domain-containing protein [Planctomycetota bacterium]